MRVITAVVNCLKFTCLPSFSPYFVNPKISMNMIAYTTNITDQTANKLRIDGKLPLKKKMKYEIVNIYIKRNIS